jgi:hypothetical protein
MNIIFEKLNRKNLKIYILYACAKLLKSSGKIEEGYNIKCYNYFHEKTYMEKEIKKQTFNLALTLPH